MKMLLQSPSNWEEVGDILIEKFPFVIGRCSESDRALAMIFVSRYHCRFSLRDKDVVVEDLESSNGTFVNGKRISLPTTVGHGDEVSLGPLAFKVIMQGISHETAEQGKVGLTNNDMTTMMVPGPPRGQQAPKRNPEATS
jgi:pSer/pThr/pTyr-binding forkhead associated (FHA) protein